MTYRNSDPWLDVIDDYLALTGQAVEDCPGCQWGQSLGDITLDAGIDALVTASHSEAPVSWALTMFLTMGRDLSTRHRAKLITRCKERPRDAVTADLKAANLTQAEKSELRFWTSDNQAGGRSLFPQIEYELAQGIVTRRSP